MLGGRNQFTFIQKSSHYAQSDAGMYGTGAMESSNYHGFSMDIGNNRLACQRGSGGINFLVKANGDLNSWVTVVEGGILDCYSGPMWLGIWSRSDGIWAGVSIGDDGRPVCHDGWMWKRQITTSRYTFASMTGSGYGALFKGYGYNTSYGMRNGAAHYAIWSRNEYYND